MLQRLLSRIVKNWKTLLVVLLSFALLWAALQWVIFRGYSLAWTGFGDHTTPKGEFIRGKTLWDWMELFIIPIFLAIGAFILNRSERDTERKRAEERAMLEREIATDRQQETALQAYLDRMSDLLLKEKLGTSKDKAARDVARIRTLTVLRQLDPNRKATVLRFLKEADLISSEGPVVTLANANLKDANLDYAGLQGIDLQLAYMESAHLKKAKLQGANMRLVHLGDAHLEGTQMQGIILEDAVMHYADLKNANLQDADLEGAKLQGAILSDANLSGANLALADLTGAQVSKEQLATAESLAGAIMPDGTRHD